MNRWVRAPLLHVGIWFIHQRDSRCRAGISRTLRVVKADFWRSILQYNVSSLFLFLWCWGRTVFTHLEFHSKYYPLNLRTLLQIPLMSCHPLPVVPGGLWGAGAHLITFWLFRNLWMMLQRLCPYIKSMVLTLCWFWFLPVLFTKI